MPATERTPLLRRTVSATSSDGVFGDDDCLPEPAELDIEIVCLACSHVLCSILTRRASVFA